MIKGPEIPTEEQNIEIAGVLLMCRPLGAYTSWLFYIYCVGCLSLPI